ncbi:unnamed protein product [Mytilus coruscus]|uniref:Uncharacterized protein n=1 Tax=Mytilus coruscus TaxID=42192 RepID=A0A6J8BHV8_MYTCO|nr:unnamed protein product [Mytilus coruscus]
MKTKYITTLILVLSLLTYNIDAKRSCRRRNPTKNVLKFKINTTWNSRLVDHDPVIISLDRDRCKNVIINVDAPFFNDPANPGGAPGQPFPGLWDYEVAEAFFLNDANDYLEVELSPHKLNYFQSINFKRLLPVNWSHRYAPEEWKTYYPIHKYTGK